jgi:heat shock protein HslJ
MKALQALLLTGALVGVLAACGDSDSDSGDASAADDQVSQGDLDLAGRDFTSTDVTVNGAPYDLVPGTTLTLGFQDDAIQANAGCNQMVGQGTYADGTLDVGAGLGMTQMACSPPAKMNQEQWYSEILASQPTLALDGDQLVLTSGDTVINYSEVQPPAAVPLTGTAWTLESLGTVSSDGSDGAMSSVPGGVVSTLQISDAGELTVDTGCNTGGADVQVEDSVITVGPMQMTMKFCDGAPGEVEQAVTSVLDGEVAYSIDDGTLTLTKGEQTLTYRADAG